MIRLCLLSLLIFGFLAGAGADVVAKAPAGSLSRDVLSFSLPTSDGGHLSLAADVDVELQVICFLGTECPLARLYGPRLQRMADEFQRRGVRFLGINSNVQDSMDDLRQYVSAHAIEFPVAKDYDRSIAMQVGATRTPEVFVIDREGVVRYSGRIDDQYQPGIARSQTTKNDLRDAIEQLLDGGQVTEPRTEAVGCLIALPRKSDSNPTAGDVTFCREVIRVLQEHCIECHRAGEIGPFSLDQYDEVVGWADMSLEVIEQGRMPPWHASPEHGTFANARQMPDQDKAVLRRWVDAGMPYGSASDLPKQPQYVDGWRLPEPPQAVFSMSDNPFEVPAEGTVEYQYFVVDPKFTEDKWVRAVQVVPGNRSVVHHCIAFVRPPDGADFRDIGMLSAYVPGQRSASLPAGYAQRIPARSRIIFQVHYTTTGKPESDNTKIGLVFAEPEEVTHEVYVLGGIEQEFEIPPHAANHSVSGKVGRLPKDGFLLSITPHMHLRGKSFQMTADRTDGSEKLLDVSHYDFNWQHSYELASPLPLQSVRSLTFKATFDNSAENATNPDPNEYVTWGDQTWQEMAVAFVAVASPLDKTEQVIFTDPEMEQKLQQRNEELTGKAKAFAEKYIARFDKNGDGSVAMSELPIAVQRNGYFDHDGDGQIRRDELEAEAYWRFQRSH